MKKTYQQGKAEAWDKILQLAWEMWDGETDRSYAEIAMYQDKVLKIARRYGLVKQCMEECVL